MTALLIWIAGALLLWLPGAALRLDRERDPLVRLAMRIAAGLAFWPVLFLWTSQIGWRWSVAGVRVVVIALLIAALRSMRRPRISPRAVGPFAVLFAAAIVLRVLQARDLVFPPWVDSVHHAMIVRLLIDQGRIPATLDPYVPRGQFYYHWGYHALVAWVSWFLGMTGRQQLPAVMLAFGQLLNALMFIMVYAAGRVLFRSRWAGLAAATLATTISVFPAFYLAWGRYTHLTGVLLLPPLLIALWRLAKLPSARGTVLVTLLATGLFLIHVRIAFFAAIAAAILAIVAATHVRERFVTAWAIAAAATVAISAPWLVRLVENRHVAEFVRPAAITEGDAQTIIPFEDIFIKHNRELFSVATCGISGMAGLFDTPLLGRILSGAWFLLIAVLVSRPRKRAPPWRPLLFIAAVTIAIGAILQLHAGGIVFTRLASNASAIITLFLPVSLAAGGLLAWVAARLRIQTAFAVVLAIVAVYGVITMRHIVPEQTILANADDLAAMRWIRDHTPANARFAVNAVPWMGEAFMGSDGGYWISVMTGRSSILPPALYAWTLPESDVAAINGRIQAWVNDRVIADPAVTHIYARRGMEKPPTAPVVYQRGSVVIYRVTAPSP